MRGLSSRARNSRKCSRRSASDIITGSVASSCSMPSIARRDSRQRANPRLHQLRHADQPQRVPGRRGVEHDQVEAIVFAANQPPMRSNSAISSAPGMLAARSICRVRFLQDVMAEQALDLFLDVGDVALRLERAVDLEAVQVRQQLHRLGPDRRARTCRRSNARDRWRPAARACRPGSPPAPSPTRRWSCRRRPCRRRTGPASRSAHACVMPHRVSGSAAWQGAERRSIHAHAPMPQVELLEQVGIDVEEIQRRRVRQARRSPCSTAAGTGRSARPPAGAARVRMRRKPRRARNRGCCAEWTQAIIG